MSIQSMADLVRAVGLFGLVAVAPRALVSQEAPVHACYVRGSGTMYRVGEPGTPTECTSPDHVAFTFGEAPLAAAKGGGGGQTIDHGSLAGLEDDDHLQYLLTEGVRTSVDGFAVDGTLHTGTIPASGPTNSRFMWYPGKAAIRAGGVLANQWDDENVGDWSTAFGWNSSATAWGSVALGVASYATGARAAALVGGGATAEQSFAVKGIASGNYAAAIGLLTKASGDQSMALGTGSDTDNHAGAFVWADATTTNPLKAVSDNQFVARASHFWLGSNSNVTRTLFRYIETSTGAYLSTGGTWTNSSDVARKTAFESVDGEAVLGRIAEMPVSTWSYRDEDASTRHMGPTAQDFRAAFGLGDTDKAIATVDADGVSLAAIQALIARTDALEQRLQAVEAELSRVRAVGGAPATSGR